jgi:lipoprotein
MMKTGRKLFAGALLVLYIVLAAGCNSAKTNAALPEVRIPPDRLHNLTFYIKTAPRLSGR